MMRKHSIACENARSDVCQCSCNGKYHGISKLSKLSKSELNEHNEPELHEEPKQKTLLEWMKT